MELNEEQSTVRQLIVEVYDNGNIEISVEGEGFLPGEAGLILEEAAAKVKRIEVVQHWLAIHNQQQQQRQQQNDPANSIITARLNPRGV